MITNVTLPRWLDDLIFNELGAKYCRSNSDMTVIDWDKNDILNYLGTYFPRSYAESYCIFKELYKITPPSKDEIRIFDFCCGTGGEVVGMLTALNEIQEKPNRVSVYALDGNSHALRLSECVIESFNKKVSFDIEYDIIPFQIDDIFDLQLLNQVVLHRFDYVVSFKAICEFVTKDRFENQNPYQSVAEFFLPKLDEHGVFILVDVTTYNDVAQEWLPKQMDSGLCAGGCEIIGQNVGFNQEYFVTHSRCSSDKSKIAWRIFRNNY